MKMTRLAATAVALAAFTALPGLSFAAEDGAALYKAKCAACHGADAAGKPALKAPAVKGKTEAQIKKGFAETPKHNGVKTMSDAQVKAIAGYLATLK
jgi:mono/diheme cytochrome c family protein